MDSIDGAADAARVAQRAFRRDDFTDGQFAVLFLADDNELLGTRVTGNGPFPTSIGTKSIVQAATELSAAAVIVVHPWRESPWPNGDEMNRARRRFNALHSRGVELRDEVFIANDGTCTSQARLTGGRINDRLAIARALMNQTDHTEA